jgi:omega-amidase
MNKPIISLIQMDVKTAKVEENFAKAGAMIEKAAKRHSNYICLPEMWSTGFAYADLPGITKAFFAETIRFLSYHAKEAEAYLIGGSIPEYEHGHVYNTSFVFDPSGKIIGHFRKVHAFSPNDEDKHFARGKDSTPIKTESAKIGIAICYDLRFPELIRKIALAGVHMLFIPAQFPAARRLHWETLAQARAIENQNFVFACNRTGKDKKYEYSGGSMIIDSLGHIIEKGSEREEVLTAQINMQTIDMAREYIPVFKDRRPEAY